jgi:hypothetical protein
MEVSEASTGVISKEVLNPPYPSQSLNNLPVSQGSFSEVIVSY